MYININIIFYILYAFHRINLIFFFIKYKCLLGDNCYFANIVIVTVHQLIIENQNKILNELSLIKVNLIAGLIIYLQK